MVKVSGGGSEYTGATLFECLQGEGHGIPSLTWHLTKGPN